jgi:lipopolysaccharide export LptBFGC system permease protein LptF
MPDIVGIISPISALISSISVSNKMNDSKEVLVLMTSGKSSFSILAPFLSFALIVSVIAFVFQGYISPYSQKSLCNLQEKVQNKISTSIIKPEIFNILGDSVIYIGKKNDNSIEDVFISYVPKGKKVNVNIITAKIGRYTISQDSLFIEFQKGFRHELDENNSIISTLEFKNFSYDVTQFVKRRSERGVKPHSKTQEELLDCIKSTNNMTIRNSCSSEFHGRFVISAISIVNSMIVALLMFRTSFRGRRKNFLSFWSFASGLLYQVLTMIISNASVKHGYLIVVNYLTAIMLIITLHIIIIRGEIK